MTEPDELEMLRSQLAAVEQLLEVHERAVIDQSDRLEQATQDARARASDAERAQAFAEQAAARLRFLADAGKTLSDSLDYETTLRAVARLAVPDFADWCVIDIVDPDGSVKRVAVEHTDPAMVERVHDLRERYPEDPDSNIGVHHVIRTGEAQIGEVSPELLEQVAQDSEHLRMLRELNLRSFIIVPLRARGSTLGALTLVRSTADAIYGTEDLELACEIAARAAAAIDTARLVTDLTSTQEGLEQSATELEAQTDELQAIVEELESATLDLTETNAELETARVDAELARDEAENARQEAEAANAAKSQFLATMSHELRTPLNAIDGYAELMEMGIHGPITEQQRHSLQRLRRAQKRLLSLINDVLNFAKLEAGQVTLQLRDVDMTEILGNVDYIIAPQADVRGIEVKFEDPTEPVVAHADAEKAEQILLNLVGNAIKFTPPGGRVTISTDVAGECARVRVSDTGPGVPADQMHSIFEPFTQLESGILRDQGGVGLGLAICRDLARSMGGDVTADSSDTVPGAVFTVLLPLASSMSPAHP